MLKQFGVDGTAAADVAQEPGVPSGALKDSTIATFDVTRAELEFHTSGTTTKRSRLEARMS